MTFTVLKHDRGCARMGSVFKFIFPPKVILKLYKKRLTLSESRRYVESLHSGLVYLIFIKLTSFNFYLILLLLKDISLRFI